MFVKTFSENLSFKDMMIINISFFLLEGDIKDTLKINKDMNLMSVPQNEHGDYTVTA